MTQELFKKKKEKKEMPFSSKFSLDCSFQMPQAVSMRLNKKMLQKTLFTPERKKGNILRQRDCNNNLDQVFVYDGIQENYAMHPS